MSGGLDYTACISRPQCTSWMACACPWPPPLFVSSQVTVAMTVEGGLRTACPPSSSHARPPRPRRPGVGSLPDYLLVVSSTFPKAASREPCHLLFPEPPGGRGRFLFTGLHRKAALQTQPRAAPESQPRAFEKGRSGESNPQPGSARVGVRRTRLSPAPLPHPVEGITSRDAFVCCLPRRRTAVTDQLATRL